MKRKVFLEVSDGREAGAFLENGLLDRCGELGVETHVLSPGARFPAFVQSYEQKGVTFSYLSAEQALQRSRLEGREARIGQWLLRRGFPKTRRWLWRTVGERVSARRAGSLRDMIQAERPDAVVALNATVGFDLGAVAAARRLGIPTLANVFSWDHPFRPQRCRGDHTTCWSDQIKDWLVQYRAFNPEEIEVIGAAAFDAYLAPEGVWSRQELCQKLGLDPARPLIVFATLGQMRQMIDETDPFREMMAAIDDGRIPGRPQVVLRLHPLSVDYYFEEYRSRSDVVFSRFTRYCPGMRWWPAQEEVTLAGNLLRHAGVCLSPGSTMAIEPSIFDTPTIVPVFNKFTIEEHQQFFDSHWMNKHFRFLKDEQLLPFASTPDELIDTVNRALNDPSWMAEGRRVIRERLLGPLDGKATQRMAEAIARVARTNRKQPRD